MPDLPLGVAFQRLRQDHAYQWLRALDSAVELSRRADPYGLPSWGSIATLVAVGDEWLRYVVRKDDLRSRYRHLPWRATGRPSTSTPPLPPVDTGVLEGWTPDEAVFQFHRLTVTLRDLAGAMHTLPLESCWLEARGYARLFGQVGEFAAEPYPPLVVEAWGGPMVVDGWGTIRAAQQDGTRYVRALRIPSALHPSTVRITSPWHRPLIGSLSGSSP